MLNLFTFVAADLLILGRYLVVLLVRNGAEHVHLAVELLHHAADEGRHHSAANVCHDHVVPLRHQLPHRVWR